MTDQPNKLYSFIYKQHARQNEPEESHECTSLDKSRAPSLTSSSDGSSEIHTMTDVVAEGKCETIQSPPLKKLKTEDENLTEQDSDEQKGLEESVKLLNDNMKEAQKIAAEEMTIEARSELPSVTSSEKLQKSEEAAVLTKITDYFKRMT